MKLTFTLLEYYSI